MKKQILSKTDGDLFNGASIALTFDYTDLVPAESGVSHNVMPVTAGSKVACVGLKLNTPFDRPGTGNLTIGLGYTSSALGILTPTQIALDGAKVLFSAGQGPIVIPTDSFITAQFVDNVDMETYTVGSVTVYLALHNLNDLPT